jgi:hypothetical protein
VDNREAHSSKRTIVYVGTEHPLELWSIVDEELVKEVVAAKGSEAQLVKEVVAAKGSEAQ